MSTVNPLDLPGRRRVRYKDLLKVSSFEKVTSFLFALNFMMGLFVIAMFFMWLGTVQVIRIEPVPIVMVEPKPPGDNPKGYEEDVEAPGLEESQDFTEPRIEETFLAVTDAVTATSGALVAMNTGATSSSHGSGLGDRRSPGGTGGGGGKDYSDRWKINITARNIDSFARILDQFGIECVVFGGGVSTYDYAKNLSDTAPTKYSSETPDGRRAYNPSEQNAIIWTKELCEKAGINTAGRFPTHIYPIELNAVLTKMEFDRAAAAGKTMDEVRRTSFEVRGSGGGFQFVITSQEYQVAIRN